MNEIMEGIQMMARSQGFYGRLLNRIYSLDEDEFMELTEIWEEMNFKDIVDFIIYIEG